MRSHKKGERIVGVQDWLLVLGIGLAYLLVLVAVIWLVFRRSRAVRPPKPHVFEASLPEDRVPIHSGEDDSHTEHR